MSSADETPNPVAAPLDDPNAQGSGVSPLEGGRWRPVKPEELLRRDVRRTAHTSGEAEEPKVRLERRQELEQHIKASPTDLDAYMELAAIYRADERPVDARRVLNQARQIFPEDMDLLWEYEEAVLARSRQQLKEVSELARRLDTLETHKELRRSQDDWACRRMDVCRARLKRDPSLVHLHVVLAEAMHDAGLHEPAIEELANVLDHDEFAPQAHLIRGKCLLSVSKDVEAMAELRAASMRRSVVGPLKTRVVALRLLCETAERLGIELTLKTYREHLVRAEKELSEQLAGH